MALFFRSQTARAIDLGDRSIYFQISGSFAGLARGTFVAEDEVDQYVLRLYAADPASAIEEISQKQWEMEMSRPYIPPAPGQPVALMNKVGQIAGAPFIPGAKEIPRNIVGEPRSDPVTIVQLGRAGDLINTLPCAWALARTNPSGKTRIVAGSDYAPLLEGCSYVDPVSFVGHVSDDYLRAVDWSQKKFGGKQLGTQVYFSGAVHGRQTESYVLDNWIKAGFSPQWWNELPVVFDRRDAMRETLLLRPNQGKKPLLLYNFAGTSSPFAQWFPEEHAKLMTLLREASDVFKLVDLGSIRADRLYDLLGLMDAAAGMITIDTATLHLAAAAKCPYIALITDAPTLWHGSIPRGNCVLQMRYGQVRERISQIQHTIESFLERPTLCHLWTGPRIPTHDANRRHILAARTWSGQSWVEKKVGEYALDRAFECSGRLLPYLRDLIDAAVAGVRDRDIIVLTNADICCSPRLSSEIRKATNTHDCLWSNRMDFTRLDAALSDEQIGNGIPYPGTDLFAFKASWWKRRRDMMPEMVYGAEGWDLCMRVLMQENDGLELKHLTYHERHDSFWERHENRFNIKSQVHNRSLARAFCQVRGHDPAPHGL